MNVKCAQKILNLLTMELRKLHSFMHLVLWLFSKQRRKTRKNVALFLMLKYQIPRFCYFTSAAASGKVPVAMAMPISMAMHHAQDIAVSAPTRSTTRSEHPVGLRGNRQEIRCWETHRRIRRARSERWDGKKVQSKKQEANTSASFPG